MNDKLTWGHGPRRRALRSWRKAPAALCAVALLAAACGGLPSASAGSSAYQEALPFAQCMRSHGIGNFPDPDSNGNFDTGNLPVTPQYRAAQSTCVRLHPYNMMLTQNQISALMAKALKFSQCMRAHGVPNFPDPTESGTGISFGSQTSGGSPPGSGPGSQGQGKPGSSSNPPSASNGSGSGPSESPVYQAATHACEQYAGKGKL